MSARKPSFVFIAAPPALRRMVWRTFFRLNDRTFFRGVVSLETAYFSSKRRFCQAWLTEAPSFWLISAVLFLTDQEFG
ncbi:MAG TPA: hypothetical protein VL283_05455, partial [Candidatus Baltobacteraceae bacterium]|nr:hypothetical protein [Candidatus Baltobacteraceae bacterium]